MVSSYDTIAYEIHEKGGNRLVLKKNFADADFLTVDIVANQNRNIDLVTMYITKKNKGSQANPPATQSSSQRGSASNNRITPTGDSVNTSIRESVKNDASPVSQEVSSAGTSIKQVPALFKNKNVTFGKVNIDIGGGKFDLATDYLSSIGTQNRVFDPYNRSSEVNNDTLEYLQQGNRADTATCANVLNVIAEPEARANVILEAAKSIAPDGKAYFMVYEGDGSGNGKRTSAGWQNNRMTDSYVEEIEAYFNDVERRGKLIIASEPKENLPKASWEIQPGQAVKFSMQEPVEESNRLIADAYFEGMEETNYSAGDGESDGKPIRASMKSQVDDIDSRTNGALKTYAAAQIKNWQGSIKIVVYESREQFSQFVDDAAAHKIAGKKLYLGRVSKSLASRILSATGINVENFNCTIQAYEIEKIFKSHGNAAKEARQGQRAMTKQDILGIPEIYRRRR